MKIEENSVVYFHYRVSEASRGELETSHGKAPVCTLIGHGNIVTGIEEAMRGHQSGDSFEITLDPHQAYGERQDGMVQRVPRKLFKGAKLVPGAQVVLPTAEGQRSMTVNKVGMSVVDVDLNHPMAGMTLTFAIEITEVREATAEEIAHHHVHGEGGHEH